MGETETGGPVLNIVPRTGGNSVSGSFFAGVGPEWLQGSNYTQELKDAGLTAATPLTKNYDYSAAVGGPLQGPALVLSPAQDAGQLRSTSRTSTTTRTPATRTRGLYDPD